MSQTLCFQSVEFDVIQQNQQIWVRGYQIGTALGYGENAEVSIRKLYTRHADEFIPAMTAVITLPTAGGPQETRIFSLRGCHLLAMFARTPVAKAFRRWVLDVIEKYGDQLQPERPVTLKPFTQNEKTTVEDRKPLKSLVSVWSRMTGIPHTDLWPQVRAQFGIFRIDQLRKGQLPAALAWVQAKIDALPQAAQKELPPAKDRYAELEDKFEAARQNLQSVQRELNRELGRLAGADRNKVPGKLLAELPDMLWPAIERFLSGGADIHESWSINPVRLVKEIHRAFGVRV